MKLIVAILQSRDFANLRDELMEKGYPVTLLSSSGGFLKGGNSTVLIGIDEKEVPAVLEIIENNCQRRAKVTTPPTMTKGTPGGIAGGIPVEVSVGGATVFILDVEKFIKM